MQQSPFFSFDRAAGGYLRLPRSLTVSIRRAHAAACNLPREELSPAGVWMEDHALFLLEETEALRRELRFSPRLPGEAGIPRVLTIAREVCAREKNEITAACVVRAVKEIMGEEELTQKEIARLRPAIACALLEQVEEGAAYCVREEGNRLLARDWAARFAAGRRDALPGDRELLLMTLESLARREDGDATRRAEALLEKEGIKREELSREYQTDAAAEGLRLGGVVTALEKLKSLPFDRVAERISPVDRELRQDRTYPRMDAESRDFYRRRACRAARRLRVQESAAARAAVELAREKQGAEGEAGYYLIERPDLIAVRLGKRKKASFILRYRLGLYLGALYSGAALALIGAVVLGAPWYTWPLVPLCFSELTRQGTALIARRLAPARMLPRIAMKTIPDDCRTLVAVPALLTSRKQAVRLMRRLAVLRLANPDPNLDYLLLADFADSGEETEARDEEIVQACSLAAEALNEKYGGGFYYLHRSRKWDMGQRRFTGRERKRGALEALNQLIAEGKARDTFVYASREGSFFKGRYAYVITLDADTFLPPGAAAKLVGAMEHPLQKGRIGVVQPRMEVAPDTVRTGVQRFLGGAGGADPYHLSVQDVYQDLFGRGSFVGKGIYDPVFWRRAAAGRLPAGRLLSHDLIEGEVVGSALADDIALYDGHPTRLSGWQKRLHRWTRGDWQLLPFLWDRRLPLLSRHKIWDNLRRSMVPAAQVLLMAAGAWTGSFALCTLALPWPLRGMGKRLPLLPGKAYTQMDAAVRALYRQFVSRRDLLSWVTADQTEGDGELPPACILAQLAAGAAVTALALLPGGFMPAALAGLSWVVSPLLIPLLDGPADRKRGMTAAQREEALGLARDTWRFFADEVGENTHFLPPDNVQEDPRKGPALRTSPTNMGLYLLSCCAAREMKLITAAEMAGRIAEALDAMEKLDTWKGHFYNWYDLSTLEPLRPLFVSTVDSGNCAGCLLCCAQLLRNQLSQLPEDQRALPARLDAMAARADFSALYDRQSHLFFVGWEAEGGRMTASHYDCLASEARLTSYLAVMTGQVEKKHWRYLDRTTVLAGGGPALLSWGGTMFEYLLPNLLLPLFSGTLLGEGCKNAVRVQMVSDPRRPFGVSESGYYAFDPDMNYQYRAFGLPALARCPETWGQAVAPYASLLALPLFPRAAAENMRRMGLLGWRDGHGFYEAADYSPARVEGGPHIVKSHMAHHQGMILCALCNALENQALVRAFMTLPAARAWSFLLWERAPRRARRRLALPPPRETRDEGLPPVRPALPGLPLEANALSGGETVWVLTGQGQGCLKTGDTMITRFDGQAGAQTGPQFYLRDRKDGGWIRPTVAGSAAFGEGEAQYRVQWRGLRVTLRCCVDPLLKAAVALLQVENPAEEERELEAVSFLELAQSGQAADEAHPNFRDLSVRVSPWGRQGLVSQRLARDERDRAPLVGHAAAGDVLSVRRQGDRTLFLGRTGRYAAPEQMEKNMEENVYRTGDTAAPCLSLTARLRVPKEGKACVCFFTVPGDSVEALNGLTLTEGRGRAAFSLAAAQGKMTLRFLGIPPHLPELYRQALGALLFFDQPHQYSPFPAPRDALWRFGVSGTLPVLLVALHEGADRVLVRHALRLHGWLRMRRIDTDLVFFCPEEKDYFRPCRERLLTWIGESSEKHLLGVPGGVYLAEGDETQARAVETLARLTLRTGQSLKAQLSVLRTQTVKERDGARLTLPEPVFPPKLRQDNTFGGFLREGGYCVKAPAPAPWHHILCGPLFGTLVCETGILHSYAGNSRLGRLTRLCPDVHRGVPSEEIYLKDGEGRIFPLVRCAAQYEPGVAAYRSVAGDIIVEVTVFAHHEKALGVRAVTLRSPREKTVEIDWTVRFSMGERPDATRCRAEEGIVTARNGDMAGVAWAAVEGARCQTLCAAACFGVSGEETPPSLSHAAHGVGSVGLLCVQIKLRPREAARLTLALGYAPDEASARGDYAALLSQGAARAEQDVRAAWARRLAGMRLFSFDENVETMMNLWLPCQVVSSRLISRMGPYQAGGAFGFRDQLQDCLALLHTDPDFARGHILLCAAHQFPEGDAQHWWHAPRRGVRTRVSDDRLFLPYLTAKYVTVTGDESILLEETPYLLSTPLQDGETERYEEPEETPWRESLLLHCLRAMDSVQFGSHGLPLMGGGDWNDGMNRVGGETGESVWLGFFLALVLKEFSPLCDAEQKEKYLKLRRRVLDSAENAWRGRWYLRAWRDGGEELGGPDTHPPRVDLISQCFSVLAGAPRDHARTAVVSALELLWDREAGMVKLLDPPFSPEENAGYIGAYLPGLRENGGQYTHAVPWLIMALCRLGEYALAWEIARAVLPQTHTDTREKARLYKIEPYVLAGDVYAGENRGRGGWSWYTGSAAWLYWVILTELLGFEKRGGKARLLPRCAPDAEEFTLVYRFGSANYHFTAARDTIFPTLDGEKLEDGWARLRSDGRTHEARFPIRGLQ